MKSEEKVMFQEMGLEGPALALVLKAGAAARHQTRVQAVLDVSYENFGDLMGWGIILEIHGTGGRFGAALWTPSTTRMGICGGSGRRHAGDGAAWQAALSAAYTGIMGASPCVTAILDEEKVLCLRLSQGQATAPAPKGVEVENWYQDYLPEEVSVETLLERTPSAFVAALCRHGLLETLGLDGRQDSAIEFEGAADLWGKAVNACEKVIQAVNELER